MSGIREGERRAESGERRAESGECATKLLRRCLSSPFIVFLPTYSRSARRG